MPEDRKTVMNFTIYRDMANLYPDRSYGSGGIVGQFMGSAIDALHDVVARGGTLHIRADKDRIRVMQYAPDDGVFLEPPGKLEAQVMAERAIGEIAAQNALRAPVANQGTNGHPVDKNAEIAHKLFGGAAHVLPPKKSDLPPEVRANAQAEINRILGSPPYANPPKTLAPVVEQAPETPKRRSPGTLTPEEARAEKTAANRAYYRERRDKGIYFQSELRNGRPPPWGKIFMVNGTVVREHASEIEAKATGKGRVWQAEDIVKTPEPEAPKPKVITDADRRRAYTGNGNELRKMPKDVKGLPLREIPVAKSPLPIKLAGLITKWNPTATLGDLAVLNDKQLADIPGLGKVRRDMVRKAVELAEARK